MFRISFAALLPDLACVSSLCLPVRVTRIPSHSYIQQGIRRRLSGYQSLETCELCKVRRRENRSDIKVIEASPLRVLSVE